MYNYVSVMAQFSKDTYLFFKLSRSKSKTPIIIFLLLCEGVQSAGQYGSNIINKPTLPTFGPLGSGRLPETPGRVGLCVTFWCTQRRAQHIEIYRPQSSK